MGSREDDDWFNVKYAEASCHEHGEEPMYYDGGIDEWICWDCTDEGDDENARAYNG